MTESVAESLDELKCSRCEYQLRGLSANALCPECGFPISKSIAAFIGFSEAATALRIMAGDYLIATLPGLGFILKLLLQPMSFSELMKLKTLGDSPRIRRCGRMGFILSIIELGIVLSIPVFGWSSESILWFCLLCIFIIEVACFLFSLQIAAEVAEQIEAGWIHRSLTVLRWFGPLMFAVIFGMGIYGALYDERIAIATVLALPIPLWIFMSLTLFQLSAAVRPRELNANG